MIYFNEKKEAFGFEIENPICTIDDKVWEDYAGTDKWDIIDGVFTDITDTPDWIAKHTPSTEEIIKQYEDAVQKHLDYTAQSRDYDNTYTCLSYLSSTDKIWRRESNAFNAWRDLVWRKCHEVLNAYLGGEIEMPTVDGLISQLPAIDWNDPEEPETPENGTETGDNTVTDTEQGEITEPPVETPENGTETETPETPEE